MTATLLETKNWMQTLANQKMKLKDALLDMTETNLIHLLLPTFRIEGDERLVGQGDGILPGDVRGQLVTNRALGEQLLAEAQARQTTIDIIYSLPGGDLDDFYVLQSSKGFFTSVKGRTTFCPVQASCEGIPSIVGVGCTYVEEEATTTLTYRFHDGSEFLVEQPKRFIRFQLNGAEAEVGEAEPISMCGADGKIYFGMLPVEEPVISRVYGVLGDAYLEAMEKFSPAEAEAFLTETDVYRQHESFLLEAVNSTEFQTFHALVQAARESAELRVFATAHTAKGMVQTRMFGSEIYVNEAGKVVVKAIEGGFGLGLLRDERMWNDHDSIDLMRLMFLGPDVVGAKYDAYKEEYLNIFSDMLYDTFRVGVGEVVVVRLLCMPFRMIFTDKFDAGKFADKFQLDRELTETRVKVLGSETETYHGCRGVRITVQREDICDLWCEGVLRAAKRANDEGVPTKLQILLSLVTFPQEVAHFVDVFEAKIKEICGEDREWVRGVSIMVETSGSYHVLEDILDVQGDHVQLNGALFGGNDFTAACLNMNRSDSANLIIPNYVRLGIFEKSPFQTLNTQIVGKAIVNGLRRTRSLKRVNQRDYLMGLGGEVAGDWESVQWLAQNAAAYGLNYVSTPPERILFSLFASAQASLEQA